jgi:hypothetical protein
MIYSILILIGIVCWYLEHKYSTKIEYKNNSLNRINLTKLKLNPLREIARYLEDNFYYSTLWRNCLIVSVIISLFFHFICKRHNIKLDNLDIILIVIFNMFVCYFVLIFKHRHQYSFIIRSATDVLIELSQYKKISNFLGKKIENYEQINA